MAQEHRARGTSSGTVQINGLTLEAIDAPAPPESIGEYTDI